MEEITKHKTKVCHLLCHASILFTSTVEWRIRKFPHYQAEGNNLFETGSGICLYKIFFKGGGF